MYENLENMLDEFNEMKELNKTKGTKYNLIPIERQVEKYMNILLATNFDMLIDSKSMPYKKKANDKLPKKVNLKIIDDLDLKESLLYDKDKQIQLNDTFINDYLKRTGINLNEDLEQRYFIFDTLNRIKDINNAIVDYYIYQDKAILNIFNFYLGEYLKQDISFVKDITYINLFNKLKIVYNDLTSNNIDNAFNQIKEMIEQFKHNYERNS